jgi:hypothetical protein
VQFTVHNTLTDFLSHGGTRPTEPAKPTRVALARQRKLTPLLVIYALACALLLMAAPPVLADPFWDAVGADQRDDHAPALSIYRQLAAQGDPRAEKAFGGRTGYRAGGGPGDLGEYETGEEIAQASPSPFTPAPAPAPKPAPAPPAPDTPAYYRNEYDRLMNDSIAAGTYGPPGMADNIRAQANAALEKAKQLEQAAMRVGSVYAAYNTKWLLDQSELQQERNTAQNGLDVLADALAHVNTNPLAPFTTKVDEYARGLGLSVGTASERAAAVQEIAKQVAQQSQLAGTDLARNMSQKGSVEAIKNPKANRAIMAQAYAKLDYERAKFDYFVKELHANRSADPWVLQQQFEQLYPREKLYEQRFNELALPGSTPLTESGQFDWPALKTGARYYLSPDEWKRVFGTDIDRPRYVRVIMQDGKRHVVTE